MSVGSVGKWLSLGALVVALGAVGCGDDDEGGDKKDSGTDAGGMAGGGSDAGKDAGGGGDAGDAGDPCAAPGAVCCGTPKKVCGPHTTTAGTFAPGCALDAKDAEVCGISTALIGFGDAGPAYLEIHAPGVASTTCGNFLDNFDTVQDGAVAGPDAGSKGNMKLDRVVTVSGMAIPLTTPGCCTPKGFCSGDTDMGEAEFGGAKVASIGGFGCMDSASFLRTAPSCYQRTPCDPTTGMIMGPPPCPVPDAGTDGGAGDGGASDAGASDAGAGDAASDASADAAGG